MLGRYLIAGFLLLLVGACATVGPRGNGSTSYEGVADTLEKAVTTYRDMEPRLTADQKQQFEEAYGQIAHGYKTAGLLLESVMKAQDKESANTSVLSYRRIMSAIPALSDKLLRLVQGFKEGK